MKQTCSTLLLGLYAASLVAQQPAPAPAAPTIRTSTQEVLLDLIARDKKGRPVSDLTAADITVTDDGVKQEIKSFRLVKGSEAAGGGASVQNSAALNPLRQIRLITLIFEGLGQEERRSARDGALALLKNEIGENVYFGVFTIGHQLHVLQQFTADKALLKAAIIHATNGAYTQYATDSDHIRSQLEGILGVAPGDDQGVRDKLSADLSAKTNGSDYVNQRFAQLTLNMLRSSESMAAEEQSRASITALINIVRLQSALPGRKTFLYFSAGLQVSESMKEQLQNLIGLANRANVSIYTIDPRGVGSSSNAGAGQMLKDAAASSMASAKATSGPVSSDQVQVFDKANDSLRANLQNNLAELSESTGGALIANSNDLRTPMRRLSEDIGAYYEIAYAPQIEKFDGRLRKINVSIARSDVKVQTRSGYFALPLADGGSNVLPFEMPMLSALTATPLVRMFPYRASALRFQPQGNSMVTDLVIEVPLKEMNFTTTEVNKLAHTHFSALMLVKDAQGNVVDKFSKDVPFEAPLDKLEAFKAGNFTLTHPLVVAPGRYTFETVVLDRDGNKLSAKKSVFTVPALPQGVGLSNLAMVRRIDKVPTVDPKDPMQFTGGKVTPSLSDTIPSGPSAALPLFFVVYPQAALKDKPQLSIEFLQDGKALGGGAMELPAAEANGTIPYIATVPLSTLKAGQYEIRVTARQGTTAAQEHLLVNLE